MAVQKNVIFCPVLAKLPYHCIGINVLVQLIARQNFETKKQKCNRCLFAFVDIQTQASLGDKKGIVKSGFI